MSSLVQAAVFDRAQPEVHSRAHVGTRSRLALSGILAIVLVAPFEWVLFAVPGGLMVTTVEATLLGALCVVGAAWWMSRAALTLPAPVVVPGGIFVLILFIAALAAPAEQGNALRFVARMGMAALVFLATVNSIDSVRRVRVVVRAFVGVATIVALVAVLEEAQLPAVMNGLTVFRPGFHVVGGQLRATSTLFYPTIASMYLEIAFALGLWLMLEPRSRRPGLERALAFIALATIGAGITATFTRAGLVGMLAALALVSGLRLARMPRTDAGVGSIGALTAVLVVIVFLSRSPELLATRLSTEGSQAWYGARYQVPATLRLETGRMHEIPVTIANTGRLTWDSDREPAFAMSYHWLRGGAEAVIQFDGQRTPFPSPVLPGKTVTLAVAVEAPAEPGTYTLVWDVVHETRAWLSTEGVPPAKTEVRVQGAPSGRVATVMARLPRAGVRPARPVLWGAALAMAAERPLLGLGPDNFRHAYGRYAGLERWDTRVHANNMYLEVLAGAGLPGLLALLWLVAATGLALVQRCRRAARANLTLATAMLAAWLMVAGHGLVDSFLSFTTTYVTFALAAGLAFSRSLAESPSHRSASASARSGSPASYGETSPKRPKGREGGPDAPVEPEQSHANSV